MSIGVPIKVLLECEGHIITIETITGDVYRGKLIQAEENMNCQLAQVTATYSDGKVEQVDDVFVRGSKIRFIIMPDMFKNAPMFNITNGEIPKWNLGMFNARAGRGRGTPRGRSHGNAGLQPRTEPSGSDSRYHGRKVVPNAGRGRGAPQGRGHGNAGLQPRPGPSGSHSRGRGSGYMASDSESK